MEYVVFEEDTELWPDLDEVPDTASEFDSFAAVLSALVSYLTFPLYVSLLLLESVLCCCVVTVVCSSCVLELLSESDEQPEKRDSAMARTIKRVKSFFIVIPPYVCKASIRLTPCRKMLNFVEKIKKLYFLEN